MKKICEYCKTEKELSEFFQPPKDAASGWQGTSKFCKQCHAEGKIEFGYGYYTNKYQSPEDTK